MILYYNLGLDSGVSYLELADACTYIQNNLVNSVWGMNSRYEWNVQLAIL